MLTVVGLGSVAWAMLLPGRIWTKARLRCALVCAAYLADESTTKDIFHGSGHVLIIAYEL